MFELDDVGREVSVAISGVLSDFQLETRITMVIKAPKGTLALFQHKDEGMYNRHLGDTPIECKCKAIRAFMEEHKDD